MRYDKAFGTKINGNYLYNISYRGVKELGTASGRHDELLLEPEEEDRGEQTETTPWEINKDLTLLVRDEGEKSYY